MEWRRLAVTAVLAAAGFASPAVAQRPADIQAAAALERQGRHREAADRFQALLDADPGNLGALFGLERVLQQVGQLERVLPYLDSAIALAADDNPVRGLQLRVLASLGMDDAVTAAAERWIAAAPGETTPYRDWAFAVAQRGDIPMARRILERGNEQLGGGALLQELAQVDVVSGDWPQAARRWAQVAQSNPALSAAAAASLSQTPPTQRHVVLELLDVEFDGHVIDRVRADLLVNWDRPGEAWALLEPALSTVQSEAIGALRRFADRARRTPTREAALTRGHALARLADLLQGPMAQQARIDAARSFADAGDRPAAERMLTEIAADPAMAPASAASAMATLIGVTADAGRVDDAERRLEEWGERLNVDDVFALRERIAWAWIRRAELERAERVLADDSTIVARALRGWIALYHGALGPATEWFRAAGPYATSRDETTRRTMMLALIQRVGTDSLPALGAALLALEAGDTVQAIDGLAEVARTLPATEGRGDLLTFAGRLALEVGDERTEPLLLEALDVDVAGPAAPAAALALAQLAVKNGQTQVAIVRLEGLILDYPGSAVVPEARRLLDQVRGAIPKS